MTIELKKHQFCKEIKDAIRRGELSPGDRLPTFTELAERHNVSMKTIRTAMAMLEQDKVVECIQGKGTFIAGAERPRILVVLPYADMARNIESPALYILPGLKKRAFELNWELVKIHLPMLRSMDVSDAVEQFGKARLSGIVDLCNHFNGDEPECRIFEALRLPVVLPHGIESDPQNTPFAVIITSQKESFMAGVGHLAANGHRRIGTLFIKNGLRGFAGHAEYRLALRGAGLDDDEELVCDCAIEEKAVLEAARKLVAAKPTAIMCFSDFMAIEAYNALSKLNVSIPGDISVMGYCNFPGVEFMTPPLASVDLKFEVAGARALDILAEADKWFVPGKKGPVEQAPFEVKHRTSCERAGKYVRTA